MDHLQYVDYKLNALKTNIIMEQAFVRNMQMLKEWMPALYIQLMDHEPTVMRLGYGVDKILNLYDINSNSALYGGDPESICAKQVSDFINNIEPLTLSSEGKVQDPEGIYSDCVRKIYEVQKQLSSRDYSLDEGELPFVMMLGGGLGLQLQYLLNAKDVKRLMYYEPHLDAFYASLHIVDWTQIKAYFDRKGYDLVLRVGESKKSFLYELTEYGRIHGTYNLLYASVYSHYNSPETMELAQHIKRDFAKVFIGLGYYDDERVGLKHTLGNIKSAVPAAYDHFPDNTGLEDLPVFVIGNGPSLDLAVDFLKRNQNDVVIISCGTSLSTLYGHGIRPDIHIEQERIAFQATLCEKYTDASFREGIRLLALNPVHEDVFKLFNKSYMLLKPNDIGSDLIQKVVGEAREFYVAYNCNPTVTNTAVSLSLLLGSRNIYLTGIDCGYKDHKKHHADNSFYDHIDEGVQDQITESFKELGNIVREGNFGGDVYTTNILDTTRANIREAIANIEDRSFYNLSDGVLIEGAEPLRVSEITLNDGNLNKEALLDTFFEEQFSSIDKEYEIFEKEVVLSSIESNKAINDIISIYSREVLSRSDIIEILDDTHSVLTSQIKNNILLWHLLGGTLESIAVLINMGCYSRDKAIALNYFNEIQNFVVDLLEKVKCELKDDPFAQNAMEKDEEYYRSRNMI